MINRSIRYKNVDIMTKLCEILVKRRVEFCTVAWSPCYTKGMVKRKKIQRRMTKMLQVLSHMEYEERLKVLQLCSLEERRNPADLMLLFKMYKGLWGPTFEFIFELLDLDTTRGHSLKVRKHSRTKDIVRHKFFSERVIDNWSRLDLCIVGPESVNTSLKVDCSVFISIGAGIYHWIDVTRIELMATRRITNGRLSAWS